MAQGLGPSVAESALALAAAKLGVCGLATSLCCLGASVFRASSRLRSTSRAPPPGRAGLDGVAVPAPEIAFAGNEPLPGLELRLKALPAPARPRRSAGGGARHGRRLDELAERRGASGQKPGRPRSVVSRQCDGRVSSLAASRSSPSAAPTRLLVAAAEADLVDDGGPICLSAGSRSLISVASSVSSSWHAKLGAVAAERWHLGFPRCALPSSASAAASSVSSASTRPESSASSALRAGEIGVASACGFELGKLLVDVARLRLEQRDALFELGLFAIEAAPLGARPRQASVAALNACSAAARLSAARAAASRSCGS